MTRHNPSLLQPGKSSFYPRHILFAKYFVWFFSSFCNSYFLSHFDSWSYNIQRWHHQNKAADQAWNMFMEFFSLYLTKGLVKLEGLHFFHVIFWWFWAFANRELVSVCPSHAIRPIKEGEISFVVYCGLFESPEVAPHGCAKHLPRSTCFRHQYFSIRILSCRVN